MATQTIPPISEGTDVLRLYEVEVSVQQTCFVVAANEKEAEESIRRSGHDIVKEASVFDYDIDVIKIASQEDVDRAEWTGCSPYGLPEGMKKMTCDAFLLWSAEQTEITEAERRQREEWERHPKLFDVQTA